MAPALTWTMGAGLWTEETVRTIAKQKRQEAAPDVQ